MPRIRAFTGYLVDAARAAQVVSPAYDAVSPAMRRAFAESHPQNYLNTMRLRDDFPPEQTPSNEQLLAMNKAKLDELLADGSFARFDRPAMFVYRLSNAAHRQTGLVCEVPIDEYQQGHLRKHENTRADKEDLLARYQQVVGVSSSPVCLAHPHHDAIDALLEAQSETKPLLDFAGEDGVTQQVWRVDSQTQRRLTELFAQIDVTYLTDGHHRAAAGLRHAETMRAKHNASGKASNNANEVNSADSANNASASTSANKNITTTDSDDAPYNQLLVALFSTEQLSLLPFHRAVRDLNGMSATQFIEQLHRDFVVAKSQRACMPTQHGEFGVLLDGDWLHIRLKESLHQQDPVESLDVSVLQRHILAPLLGIDDPRNDSRLDYVSGVSGERGLMQKQQDGWAVCFACCATSIEQLMTVADAAQLMPPKSTYFDPKARSGIFIRPR